MANIFWNVNALVCSAKQTQKKLERTLVTMATIFDKQYFGRPCLLLTVWALGLAAFLFLLFGMMIDELTRSSFEINTIEYKVVCSSRTFDTIPGTPNRNYIEVGYTETLLQKQAGDVWLAFGILACWCIPTLLYGIFTDYYAGVWDYKKLCDCSQIIACCPCQQMGFTSLSCLLMMLFEFLQIFGYSVAQVCGSEEFYEQVFLSVNDLKSIGGPYVYILALIVYACVYTYT